MIERDIHQETPHVPIPVRGITPDTSLTLRRQITFRDGQVLPHINPSPSEIPGDGQGDLQPGEIEVDPAILAKDIALMEEKRSREKRRSDIHAGFIAGELGNKGLNLQELIRDN